MAKTLRVTTDQELDLMWRCHDPKHRDRAGACWTSSHISRADIEREAQTHSRDCYCWRHRILANTDETGAYIGLTDGSFEGKKNIIELERQAAEKDHNAAHARVMAALRDYYEADDRLNQCAQKLRRLQASEPLNVLLEETP